MIFNLAPILLICFILHPIHSTKIFNGGIPPMSFAASQISQPPQQINQQPGAAGFHRPLQGVNQLDQEAFSMWNSSDGQNYLTHLDASNFKETVLTANKKTDFLVIFYSHTCPHCQGVAPMLIDFAKSAAIHRDKITIGVYNCKRPFNAIYCRQVKSYPTVFFYTKSALRYGDGKLVAGFGDMLPEEKQSTFEHLMAGKFDLNESGEDLLRLDASSYMLTVSNGIRFKTFLIAFVYGPSQLEWDKLAQLCSRWKQFVRIAIVDCALDGNRENPCQAVLGNYSAANFPTIFFIYEKYIPNPADPNSQGKWTSQYERLHISNNAGYLRRQLVFRLFQANSFNVFKRHLANNLFIDDFQFQPSMQMPQTNQMPPISYNSRIFVKNMFNLFPNNKQPQINAQNRQNLQQQYKMKLNIGGFPATSSSHSYKANIKISHSQNPPSTQLDQIGQMLPQFWRSVKHFMQIYIVLVFEHDQTNFGIAEFASKLILSLNHLQRFILILPIRSTNPMVANNFGTNQFANFPYVRVYKTGQIQPLISKNYGMLEDADLQATKDFLAVTGLMEDDTRVFEYGQPIECDKLHTRCNPLYFASETDILKALREAIFDEVVTKVEIIEGKHRQNLLAFLSTLEKYLPDYSRIGTQWKPLQRTRNARLVIGQMKNLLLNSPRIDVKQWEMQLRNFEQNFGNPFPTAAEEWRHCKAIQLLNARRFTCGMWTTFHVLTVNAYKKKADALEVLKAIQGWVESFFGCEDCRSHFMEMTTETMPIEYKVRKPEDVVLYLWRAHNIVNERLAKEEMYLDEKKYQSDFIFKKQQFPPKFLCPKCEYWNEPQMLNFLLTYYERIEPAHPMEYFPSWERDLAYSGQ